MKKSVILFLATLFIFVSCTKESQIIEDNSIVNNEYLISSRQNEAINFQQIEVISERLDEFKSIHESKLQRSGCVQTVFVPDDYSTIQEAVDAVCDYGNVFVRSGVYNESPGIFTPGLFIKAIGDVTLKGGFGMAADDVKIHGFNIDCGHSEWGKVGIASAPGFNGFDIKHNIIYGSGHIGIYFEYCDNARIVQNQISGDMEAGIWIDAVRNELRGIEHPFGGSINNTISNNTVTDIISDINNFYPAFGIVLRGNTDNNRIQGNTVNTTNGWGISLEGWAIVDLYCDNNIIKNNVSTNSALNGIDIFGGGTNNVLGPNNQSNDNGEIGIYLYEGTTNNYLFKNSTFNNTICDIVDEGTDNRFKKNEAGCTFGLD